jgi:hypothetical protein
MGSLTRSRLFEPPEGGNQRHRLSWSRRLSFCSRFSIYFRIAAFVSTYGRDEEPSGPETPSHEIVLSLPVRSGQVDRTLARDETDHMKPRISVGSRSSCEHDPA